MQSMVLPVSLRQDPHVTCSLWGPELVHMAHRGGSSPWHVGWASMFQVQSDILSQSGLQTAPAPLIGYVGPDEFDIPDLEVVQLRAQYVNIK